MVFDIDDGDASPSDELEQEASQGDQLDQSNQSCGRIVAGRANSRYVADR